MSLVWMAAFPADTLQRTFVKRLLLDAYSLQCALGVLFNLLLPVQGAAAGYCVVRLAVYWFLMCLLCRNPGCALPRTAT